MLAIENLRRFNFDEPWKNWIVRVGYILLQQTDLVLTIYGLSRGFVELNPFLSSVMPFPIVLIMIKAVVPLLIALLLPAKLLVPGGGLLLFVNIWDVCHLIRY